jgi:hypothetical protein
MRFDDRREVTVTGPWSDEMLVALESGVADRLVLNYALGFDEPDLRFLEYLPIRELVILDRRITDLTPVYTLAPKLELLHLTVDPSVHLDLTELPNLHDLRANWRQVADTISAARGLRAVALGSYQPADLLPLCQARGLTSISMKDRPKIRDLDGLGEFESLVQLGIFGAPHLEDISAVWGRDKIEVLEFQACPKVSSITALERCTGLRKLNVAEGARLPSAAPLAGLTSLEKLYLYDTTAFVDGDLTPIAQLPRLQELRMQNRRHYHPSVPEIQASLPKA